MAQYSLFLILAPLAFIGTLIGMLLPRFHRSYHRFMRLYILQFVQLGFLIINTAELLSPDPVLKRYLAAGDYLFLGIGTSLFFLFSLEYTSFLRRFKAWEAALMILPVLCWVVGSSPAYSLIWKELRIERVGWLLVARTSGYGILARIIFFQAYFLTFTGAWIIAWFTLTGHSLYRRQTRWMLLGVTVPTIVSAAYVAHVIPGWEKDYSAIAISFGNVCFAIASLRYRLFAVVPISRQAVMEYMRHGMLVVDSNGTIIDLNQTACSMLGKSDAALLGSPAAPVLKTLESRYEVSKHPIAQHENKELCWHFEIKERGDEEMERKDSPVLSLGELRVVEMLAHNLSNKEIGARLGVSANTVKFHLGNVFRKTGTSNRAELVDRLSEIRNSD